jgi:hypothetical protein
MMKGTSTRVKKENKSKLELQPGTLLYLFTPLIKIMRNKTPLLERRELRCFSPRKLVGCASLVCSPNEAGSRREPTSCHQLLGARRS